MAINGSVQYNGGLLPDIILLTQGYYHRGTRLNAKYVEVLSLQATRYETVFYNYGTLFDDVYMYDHTYSNSMDQPGKVANPARGQLNRENTIGEPV